MIYLHTPEPLNGLYDEADQYLTFAPDGKPICDGTCGYCPLEPIGQCLPVVVELLSRYPNPTILTQDTHPEIFL